jgi:hypothetical protein
MFLRCLGLLALVFVALFALQLVAVMFPWQPLSPDWQWRLSTTLINGATLPLLALAVLQIAVVLDPDDPILRQRQRLFRQLAVLAAAGFLLLIPLETTAGLRQQNALHSAQVRKIQQAEQRLVALIKATADARSTAELNSALQKLRGPVLSPADLALPLPLARAQLQSIFNQAGIQISRDRAALPTNTVALPEVIRYGLASLALGVAFAAFARRPGQKLSVLEESQLLFRALCALRPGRSPDLAETEFISRLQGEVEQD